MSWDIARDGETGDWIFSANRDYEGRDGDDLVKQRIAIRLKIPRGSWIYDLDNNLGSRLYDALRYPTTRAVREIPEFIREALDDMTDITVVEVSEPEIDDKQIRTTIQYRPASGRTGDLDQVLEETFVIPIPTSTEFLRA